MDENDNDEFRPERVKQLIFHINLVLLDLSTAFYTVDHNILVLLTRLSDNVGLCDVPLTWFTPYFIWVRLVVLSQGPLIWPVVYHRVPFLDPSCSQYMQLLNLEKSSEIWTWLAYVYADYTPLYECFNTCAIAKLEKYMAEIEKRLVINKLKLNGEKLCHHRFNICSEKAKHLHNKSWWFNSLNKSPCKQSGRNISLTSQYGATSQHTM